MTRRGARSGRAAEQGEAAAGVGARAAERGEAAGGAAHDEHERDRTRGDQRRGGEARAVQAGDQARAQRPHGQQRAQRRLGHGLGGQRADERRAGRRHPPAQQQDPQRVAAAGRQHARGAGAGDPGRRGRRGGADASAAGWAAQTTECQPRPRASCEPRCSTTPATSHSRSTFPRDKHGRSYPRLLFLGRGGAPGTGDLHDRAAPRAAAGEAAVDGVAGDVAGDGHDEAGGDVEHEVVAGGDDREADDRRPRDGHELRPAVLK